MSIYGLYNYMINDFDFVIGAKGLSELEADASFKKLQLEFTKRSIDILSVSDINIPPGTFTLMTSRMKDSSPGFEDG